MGSQVRPGRIGTSRHARARQAYAVPVVSLRVLFKRGQPDPSRARRTPMHGMAEGSVQVLGAVVVPG